MQKLYPVFFVLRNFLNCKKWLRQIKNVKDFPHFCKFCDTSGKKNGYTVWPYIVTTLHSPSPKDTTNSATSLIVRVTKIVFISSFYNLMHCHNDEKKTFPKMHASSDLHFNISIYQNCKCFFGPKFQNSEKKTTYSSFNLV